MTDVLADKTGAFPDVPKFSDEDMRRCRETGDYKPVMFEWYKFVGGLCNTVAYIMPNSPAYRQIPAQHYQVLVGLLNRCARLMLSNVALSCQRKFGETTAIVDRCIFESVVNITWLCHSNSQEEFTRYLASGLKTELELKAQIERNIETNGGVPMPIEARMLRSIDKHISSAGLTHNEVATARKQRDLASMIEALGQERLLYVVGQKIGSHHVHGTWSSLLIHYLEQSTKIEGFPLSPSSRPYDTHINQFMFIPMIVLDAMIAFVQYTIQGEDADAMCSLFSSTDKEIWRIYREAGEDAR